MSNYHPPLQENLMVPNLSWRENQKTRPLPILSSLAKSYLQTGLKSHEESTMGVEPLSGGPRGSNPWQDPNDHMYQRHQLRPYSIPKGGDYDCLEQPFYHVNCLASAGGMPLKIAMDEPGQLNMMVHNEKMRIHPSNPLSAAYAQRVIQSLQQDPYRGPINERMRTGMETQAMDDSFRRDIPMDKFDNGTVRRMRKHGYVGHPEMAAWVNGKPKLPHQEVLDGMDKLFTEPLKKIGENLDVSIGHLEARRLQQQQNHPNVQLVQTPAEAHIATGNDSNQIIQRTPFVSYDNPMLYGGGLQPSGGAPIDLFPNTPESAQRSNTPIRTPTSGSVRREILKREESNARMRALAAAERNASLRQPRPPGRGRGRGRG